MKNPDNEPIPAAYMYKMHANPRTTGIDNRFFIQAYEKNEHGHGFIPKDVLYIGAPERCRELLNSLLDGRLTPEQVKAIDLVTNSLPADDAREKTSIRATLRLRIEQGVGKKSPKNAKEREL